MAPTWSCCIFTPLLSSSVGSTALNSSWLAPSFGFTISWLFRCRVLDPWRCRAAGSSVGIPIITLLVIYPISPKESAVGQEAEMDKGPHLQVLVWHCCLSVHMQRVLYISAFAWFQVRRVRPAVCVRQAYFNGPPPSCFAASTRSDRRTLPHEMQSVSHPCCVTEGGLFYGWVATRCVHHLLTSST